MAVPHSGIPAPALPLPDAAVDALEANSISTPALTATGGTLTGLTNVASAAATIGAADVTDLTADTVTTPALSATGGALTGLTNVVSALATINAARFKGQPWHDVKAYGAVGDGVTDDTAAIQAAVTAASGGDVLFLPRASDGYKITSSIEVNKELAVFSDGAEVAQATVGTQAFLIAASRVSIEGLKFSGTSQTNEADSAVAVEAIGTAAAPYDSITIRNCTMSTWGHAGVHLKHCTNVNVSDNRMDSLWYGGILLESVIGGVVAGNVIDGVVGTPNAYGIFATRGSTDSLVTDPRSSDITIVGNVIKGIPVWEGIDTHAGQRITIANNIIEGCSVGIAAIAANNGSGVSTFAPLDISIVGNAIDSGLTTGASVGISFSGAAAAIGTPTQYGTGTISGNTIRGHGDETNLNSAAILALASNGLSVTGNTIIEPSPAGITFYHTNRGFSAVGNAVIDAWSNTTTSVFAIGTRSTHNRGIIAGNILQSGTKAATNLNTRGISLFSDATNSAIEVGANDMSVVTGGLNLFDSGNVSAHAFRGKKVGFYAATPIVKPSVSGSRGGNAALDSLLTQLAALGLITNSTSA